VTFIDEFEETNLDVKNQIFPRAKKTPSKSINILIASYQVENTSNEAINISYENWGHNFLKINELENTT